MNTMPTDPDYAQPLYTLAEQVLSLCRQSGADQAEVSLSQDTGFAANVRLGEVETVERTNDQGVAVTVYVNQRKGTASTADLRPESLRETVAQAYRLLYKLERACKTQVLAMSTGKPIHILEQTVIDKVRTPSVDDRHPRSERDRLYFEAMMRVIDRVNPGYAD